MTEEKKEEVGVQMPESVVTLDGETVLTESAFALNYGRMTAAMKAVRDPAIRDAISAMREAMRGKGPSAYCVSPIDTPKAKQLAALIGSIKLSRQKNKDGNDMEPPAVWIPYIRAYEGWEKFMKKEMEDKGGSPQSDPVTEIKAKVVADALKRAETVAALGEFIPDDVKAKRDQRSSDRKAKNAEDEELEKVIGPVVNGHACVDNDSRPLFLKIEGRELSTSRFDDFLISGLCRLEDAPVECVFCGAKHNLGSTVEVRDRDGATTKKFLMRQIAVPSRTMDGKNGYIYRSGPREGAPKKFFVAVCRRCGSIATRLSPSEPDPRNPEKKKRPSVLPRDLYPAVVQYQAHKGGAETLGDKLQSEAGEESQQALRQDTWGSGLKVSGAIHGGANTTPTGKPRDKKPHNFSDKSKKGGSATEKFERKESERGAVYLDISESDDE